MKKIISVLTAASLVLTCAGCSSATKETTAAKAGETAVQETTAQETKAEAAKEEKKTEPESKKETESKTEGGKLVLYTSTAQDNLDIVLPAFEEATGIKVELIRGSTGEINARIQAEAQNPYGDVAWIPESYILSDPSYFESYVSENDSLYDQAFRNTSGYATNINYAIPVIIYNKELVDFEITGYADLLKPELKGKIAMGNAASSSSAYNQLENMVLAMGKGDTLDAKVDSEEAWAYVEEFLKNLDGIIVDSSSATYKGVLSGEYAVGMSWDTPAQEYLADKVENVGVVYMKEGVIPKQSSVAVIKNASNMENAKKFVDYMSSQEGQSVLGAKVLGANPLMSGVEIADYKMDISSLHTIPITTQWSADKKEDILKRYEDLYLDILE